MKALKPVLEKLNLVARHNVLFRDGELRRVGIEIAIEVEIDCDTDPDFDFDDLLMLSSHIEYQA